MKAKYIPVLLWALCILIATNNYNFTALLANDIDFNIRLFPNLSDLFITSDIHLDSKLYVFQKTGHALSFGILYLLMNQAVKERHVAFVLCSLFAFFTEFLQLFFERSGRLVDVLIDIAGVYAAYRLSIYVKAHGGIVPAFSHATQTISNVLKDDKTH
ncbi:MULTISPECIES: VanZ family protein [unclassified Planococcus (in: firmicutes)]|uniref:VanZ family protein n=1 Tax=unclassified Planococcus (in: firmicutes) TaxID=2662419 RepID=UPI000C31EA69|nr:MULTISPECIES: VanZ family protein [unclassified Planococcus (in: firmicutes)]AUD14471.1 VanZ family protein [Planococcus sp. MB-3u-03]PKG44746.1 VanZ family protein [Planococcus sp. Urea-trap-24]PKG87089.1 VanZ family protein [Planococcus sp. Urea-3u-39]PKH41144.1 VanZ family protein [Planococcus sp. MB-3u-09]